MKIYLDTAPFPPGAEALAANAAYGSAMLYSAPWPAEYAGLEPGGHDIPEPAPMDAPKSAEEVLTLLANRMGMTIDDLRAIADAV